MGTRSDYQVTALAKSSGAGAIATAIGPHEKTPWRKAIELHLSRLTPKQLKDLSCPTDSDDLIEALRGIEKRAKSRKTAKFLEFLSTYTMPLQQFQGVIEVVIQTNAEIGSPIWAPMKLVLLLLKNHNDAYDIIADQFSLICRKLPVYEAYYELFSSSTILQNALADIYIDYLDFCFKISGHFQRKGLLNLFRSMWRPFPEEFKEILNNMDRHRQSVEDAVNVSALTEQVTTHRSARQEKILRWLSPSIFDSELNEFERKWVPGTCEWILQRDEYNGWLRRGNVPGRPGLLWISWPAGHGKSFIAHFLRKSLPSRQPPLFFLFNSKQENSGKKTTLAFLRTILHQLLTRPLDKDILEACFSTLGPIVEQSGHDQASSVNSLWDVATAIFQKFPSLYLVIDALDECDVHERNLVLEKLVSIMQSNKGLNIVITSRPEINIQEVVKDSSVETCFRLEFAKKFVNKDLKRYLESRLKQLEKFSSGPIRERVETEVLERADGMFLYVRLMIDELESEVTSDAVFKRLGNLPKNIIDYYHTVLQKIGERSEDNRQLARDIFLWVLTTYRPLKVQELISALGAQRQRLSRINGDKDPNWSLLGDPNWSLLGDPRRAILDSCFPLIEVLEDQTIQFIHTSVTQYLRCEWSDNSAAVSMPILPFAYEMPKSHSEVLLVALDFLSHSSHQKDCSNNQEREDQKKGTDVPQVISEVTYDPSNNQGFYPYCVLNWGLHAREAEACFEEQKNALFTFCGPETKALSEWIQARSRLDFRFKLYFGLKRSRVEPSPLHIAAYFGLHRFTDEILLTDLDLAVIDATGATPLHIAAEQGFDKLMQRITDAGAHKALKDNSGRSALHRAAAKGHLDIECLIPTQDVDCLDKMGRSALFIACRYGKETVARKLLANGANPCLRSVSGETPLSTAVTNGHLEISRLLLDTGKEWESLADKRGLCYLVAARKGYTKILELLLLHGVDLNAVDDIGQNAVYMAVLGANMGATAVLTKAGVDIRAKDYEGKDSLEIAVRSGNKALVELLLNSGIKINEGDNGQKIFFIAVENMDEAIVDLLLKSGAEVNAKDSYYSKTALHYAAERGNEAMVDLLLKSGAEVNAKDKDSKTALHHAARWGNEAMVDLLLKSGAEVNAKGYYSQTALHHAARWGNEAMVDLLLKSGAEVNAKDKDSKTALHHAAERGNEAMVDLLLKSGAEVNAKDYISKTALHYAAERGNEAMLDLLLKSGAEVNAKGYYSQTALHHAAERGNEAMVDLLLKSGAEVNAKGYYSQTALHYAAERGNEAMVDLLLKSGAEVNAKGYYSQTALHYAAQRGNEAMVDLLLKSGAEVNVKDEDSKTALHYAEERGNEAMVDLLLKSGAEVNAKDKDSKTALHHAAERGNEAMVDLLLKSGAEVNAKDKDSKTALHHAAERGNEAMVDLLLGSGVKVDTKDGENRTALQIAADKGYMPIVGLLLEAGANANVKTLDRTGTFLHSVVGKGDATMIGKFLKHGADPNEVDDERCTPLHLVARRGYEALVQPLLESGSIVDALDNSRSTGLHYACENGFIDIIEELLEADADYSILNNDGKTPVDLATERGDLAILALFS